MSNRVLIDGDMPAHEIGHIKVDTGKEMEDGTPIKRHLGIAQMRELVKGRILSIILNSESGGYKVFTTRGPIFRDREATISGYKANRLNSPRDYVDKLKDYIEDTFDTEVCEGYEADDGMAMWQWADLLEIAGKYGWKTPDDWDEGILMQEANTVIATRDKDLDNVPGWHWKWWVSTSNKRDGTKPTEKELEKEKGEAYWVSWPEACRHFYKQMLIGDPVDNIKGLYNIGPKSAWAEQLDGMEEEDEMYEHVLSKYVNYFNNYAMQFLKETGRMLWMWRRKDDEWLPPEERDEDYWK